MEIEKIFQISRDLYYIVFFFHVLNHLSFFLSELAYMECGVRPETMNAINLSHFESPHFVRVSSVRCYES